MLYGTVQPIVTEPRTDSRYEIRGMSHIRCYAVQNLLQFLSISLPIRRLYCPILSLISPLFISYDDTLTSYLILPFLCIPFFPSLEQIAPFCTIFYALRYFSTLCLFTPVKALRFSCKTGVALTSYNDTDYDCKHFKPVTTTNPWAHYTAYDIILICRTYKTTTAVASKTHSGHWTLPWCHFTEN